MTTPPHLVCHQTVYPPGKAEVSLDLTTGRRIGLLQRTLYETALGCTYSLGHTLSHEA